MSTYTPPELLALWQQEKLTADMAIGHLLQNLSQQAKQMQALQAALSALNREVEQLKMKHEGVNVKPCQNF